MFRIAKREKASITDSIRFRFLGFLAGLLLSMVFIALLGYNPFSALVTLLIGAFGTGTGLRNTLTFAIPLATTALGLSVAFRMKFWNIGGEGQLLMGAAAAMFVSLAAGENTSGWILIPMMLLFGFIGGAFFALIPGLFRVYFRTNETLFTLMMNYLAIAFVKYLYHVLWKDPLKSGFPGIRSIQEQAGLPRILGVSTGIFVPIILMIIIHILITRTKPGYEIRVVGESEPTAHYAGMNVRKIMIGGVILSGGIVGLAGAVKLSGETLTLTESLGAGTGFTAIVIAWLANLSAPIIIVVSFLFAALQQGAQTIQLRLNVPAAVAEIIKGVMLMSFLGSEFFLRYRIIFNRRYRKQSLSKTISPGQISEIETEAAPDKEVKL